MSRSLPPTPRRLRESRRRGEIAASRLLTGFASLAAGGAVAVASVPDGARDVAAVLRARLASPSPAVPVAAGLEALALLARLALPPCAAALAGGLLAGLVQSGGLLAPGALAWRWDRLSPGGWPRRVASPAAAGRAIVALAAPVAALAVAAWVLAPRVRALSSVPRLDPASTAAAAGDVLRAVAGALSALLVASAAVELLLARVRHRRRLRMTRAEVERDHREDEGDPRLRAERRRLHRGLLGAPARRPACVVVNPTHVAVALRHRPGDDEAPVVAAKGAGRRAVALRREARRLGIPVVHDAPLARALHRLADVGDEIPEELYAATAVVLAHVHGMRTEASA